MEKRDPVGFVKGKAQIEDWQPLVVLWLAKLNNIDITGLAIFVGRVVRDIDALPVIHAFVPCIQEAQNLILGYAVEEAADR